MVTRILCRSAVLSCLLLDCVDDAETRHSHAARSTLARTAISIWVSDLVPGNNGASKTSAAQPIGTTNTIDVTSRLLDDTAGPSTLVVEISRAPARTYRERLIISNDPRPQKCLAAPAWSTGSYSFSPQRRGFSTNLLVARE
jgi:hypothetical protein